jgi:hypothetical protein
MNCKPERKRVQNRRPVQNIACLVGFLQRWGTLRESRHAMKCILKTAIILTFASGMFAQSPADAKLRGKRRTPGTPQKKTVVSPSHKGTKLRGNAAVKQSNLDNELGSLEKKTAQTEASTHAQRQTRLSHPASLDERSGETHKQINAGHAQVRRTREGSRKRHKK